jgi:phosphoglycolate phosphatase
MTHVLFWDIDGTLLTTGRAGIFAWQDALRETCGVELDLESFPTSGLTDAEIARRLVAEAAGDSEPALAGRTLRAYEDVLAERLHLRRGAVLPGVEAILEDLRGRDDVLSLLLTGNTARGAAAKLAHYGLDGYLTAGSFCEGVGPRAEIARRALALATEMLGAPPELDRTFVIGDTVHDVRCGKAIGARTVAICGTVPMAELEAEEPWLLLAALPSPAEFLRRLGIQPKAKSKPLLR